MSLSPFHVFLSLATLSLSLALPFQTMAQPIAATVISTGDGDTFRMNQNGQTVTVRLACIDSPEQDQPGGQAAAERLQQLLPRTQAIQVIAVDQDRYEHTVGVVFVDGRSINLQMVEEGQAVVYQEYLSSCPNSRNELLAAEAEARSAQRGFWAQSNPVMPWDWRQSNRSVPATTSESAPAQTTSNLPACINSDCDCRDFASQAEAQRVFNAFPRDPFRLDRDGDGLVCEGREQ